jgi:hypothetical protein
MTNIERFQRLQIELVRAGFETELRAGPNGDRKAVVMMYVDLHDKLGGGVEHSGIEVLDNLTAGHGFAYSIGENSRAAINLVPA